MTSDPLIPALIAAIAALAAAIGLIYKDKGKVEEKRVAREAEHAQEIIAVKQEFTSQIRGTIDAFSAAIKQISKEHQDQENEIHARYQKAVEDLVRDHRKELMVMIDRRERSEENERAHRRERDERMIEVIASLDRGVRERSSPSSSSSSSSGGGSGTRR